MAQPMNDIIPVAASDMASAAILAALITRLHDLGTLDADDVSSIYDHAFADA